MKYVLITALNKLEVSEFLGRGAHIVEDFYISNDVSRLDTILTPRLMGAMGSLEAGYLRECAAFAYSAGDWPLPKDSKSSLAVLNAHLEILQLFFTMLWVVLDNSANTGLAFIEVGPDAAVSLVSSVKRSVLFTTSRGHEVATRITKNHLETARSHLKFYEARDLDRFRMSDEELVPDASADRISRSLYFLQGARASNFIPEKVTFYCICMETLVSTDTTELSHKVAERVAWLVASDPEERKAIYRTIKKAYALRSQTVHGSSTRFLREENSEVSEGVDSILRKMYQALFTDAKLAAVLRADNQAIDEFFLSRVLGG